MTSFIFHRKNTSPTEYTFVRWIHLDHRKVDLSIGVRLPVLDIYGKLCFNIIDRTKKRICIKFAWCIYVANMKFAKLCNQCKGGNGRICTKTGKLGHCHLCTGCKALQISYLQHICTRQNWGKFNFSSSLLEYPAKSVTVCRTNSRATRVGPFEVCLSRHFKPSQLVYCCSQQVNSINVDCNVALSSSPNDRKTLTG